MGWGCGARVSPFPGAGAQVGIEGDIKRARGIQLVSST